MEDYYIIGDIKCPTVDDSNKIQKKENTIERTNIRNLIMDTYYGKNNYSNQKEYLYKLYNHIIDLTIIDGISLEQLFKFTLKGFLIDKTYPNKKPDYFIYFDTLIERCGTFPVELLFENTYEPNTTFFEEISNYELNGLFIDYVADKKIETSFLQYADWKNIKEHSIIWYINQYKNNHINNENNFENRMSVLKFYSKYLKKKYPYK